MRVAASALLAVGMLACNVPVQHFTGVQDAPIDSPPVTFSVFASPSSFVLHVNDQRETKITIVNGTTQTIGMPSPTVTGLTLGTLTFSANTCTAPLAAGASCSVVGTFTAQQTGQADFAIVAMADSLSAMAPLSTTIMAACPTDCGPAGASNCCESPLVPGNAAGAMLAGMPFYRSYDVASDGTYMAMDAPATVGDFRLDTYEVTVERFRAFVNTQGEGTQTNPPAMGDGAHAGIPSSGWDTSWNTSLIAAPTAWTTNLTCGALASTWTSDPGSNDTSPINCITWFEAMAFCIWDGGYLPTEAEWNYAAAGGSEQRAYPWSSPAGSTTISCANADYAPGALGSLFCVNSVQPPTEGVTTPVGSESPAGDGKWGHADLGGNLSEWNLDWYASPYSIPSCNDCANLAGNTNRVVRGGSSRDLATVLRTADRDMAAPAFRSLQAGVRCARRP